MLTWKRWRPSIARNLIYGFTGGLTLFWLIAVALGGYQINHEMNEGFDQSLRQTAIRLLPLAIHDLTEDEELEEAQEIADASESGAPFGYIVTNQIGKPVITSGEIANNLGLDTIAPGFSSIGNKRLFSLKDDEEGFSIVVIEDTVHRDAAFWETVLSLLVPLGTLVPLTAIGVWFAIRRALKPLDQLRAEIEQRDSHDLSALSVGEQPLELAPIADAIAALMERLRLALEAERTFAANSAHELRTPLAGALAQVQRLSIEMQSEKGSERLKEIGFSLRHLSNLSEQLLQLSRLESGFARSGEMVDLTKTLKLIVSDFQADTAINNRLILSNTDNHALTGNITKDAFAVVMRNLIQNAFKHGSKTEEVTIEVTSSLSLTVVNQATAVISDDVLQQLSKPFQRGITSAEGTGLGLSIVRTVMNQCAGSLKIRSAIVDEKPIFEAAISFKDLAKTELDHS